MSVEAGNKINQLLQKSNPGELYFSSWLKANGYSDQLVKKYRDSGWLSALSKAVMCHTGDHYGFMPCDGKPDHAPS